VGDPGSKGWESAQNPLLVDVRTPRKSGVPVPHDALLPRLGELLDGESFGSQLSRAVGHPGLRAYPRYIRYKPGNKAIVLHEVRFEGRSTWAVTTMAAMRDLRKVPGRLVARQLMAAVESRCRFSPPVMFLEEPGVLVEWYPANLSLPGLAVNLGALAGWLRAAGWTLAGSAEPELVIYKPERRATLRWGSVYLKCYARQEDYLHAKKGLAVAAGLAGVTAPPALGQIAAARLTAQWAVVGAAPSADAVWCRELGAALARLHASQIEDLPTLSPAQHFGAARSTCTLLSRLLPQLSSGLEDLLVAMGQALPPSGTPVVSHGDFHVDQALRSPTGVVMLDFDHMCLADRALDPATLAAHFVNGRPSDVDRALIVLDDVQEGYGPLPPRLRWYLAVAILRRAIDPFRFLDPEWPLLAAAVVDACWNFVT
jgi:Phosphotransferase enzyme family